MEQKSELLAPLVFENDHVHVEVEKKPSCLVQLTALVKPVATQAAYQKALKEVRKQVSIPGFRKGKVPDEILKHQFASAIQKEFRDTALQTAFNDSTSLSNIYPFSRNSIRRSELQKCSLEEGAKAVFVFETKPDVPAIEITSIQTRPTPPKELSQDQVDIAYNNLLLSKATWENVGEETLENGATRSVRPAEIGDYVELDIDVTQAPAHNVCINQLFHLTEKECPKWLLDATCGLYTNDSKEVTAKPHEGDPAYPIQYDESNPAKECRVSLKNIRIPRLPPQDEAFFQSYGASSSDELKKLIEQKLKTEEELYANELSRYNLRVEMLEKYPFDIPESLVSAEVNERVHQIKASSAFRKTKMSEKELKAQVEAEARGFFTWMFLVQPFAKEANLSITMNDLEAEFQNQMRMSPLQSLIYPSLSPEEVRQRLTMLVMMRKCEDYLLAKVVI
jgi:trigger factor